MHTTSADQRAEHGMELLVGYILLGGVLTSALLMSAGLVWHWAGSGQTQMDSPLPGMNLAQIFTTFFHQAASGALQPRLLIDLGLGVLLFTPYLRVAASALYFAIAERNVKYTVFTGFVLAVLTYSLFIR
ncbi:MAG TPA: DUF1634 domain-containing protein [bacterium]|nr:DUF1634 domain-containing protein [bacterium]